MRIKLIANPISGGDARPRIQQAVNALTDQGATVDLLLTSGRGDARKAAGEVSARDYDRIAVAGGDGTLNEVINGLSSSELPVAFLPMGTVNVFALETGIPFDLQQACRLAMDGKPQRISLGRINGEAFLLMASAGWDAEAVARLRPGIKRILGRVAYAVSALETLLLRSPPLLKITLPDGEQIDGYGAVVSNARYYGGRYSVTPQASIFRESLELCVLQRRGRLAMLRFALRLVLGWALRAPEVAFYAVDRVSIQGEGIYVQVDGDAWGQLPATIEAWPEAVTMVLPDRGECD